MALSPLDISAANIGIDLKRVLLKMAGLENGDLGTVSGTGATVAESVFGGTHRTVITLAGLETAVTEALSYGSTKIYTFPQGRIQVVGALATLAIATPGTRAGLINDNSTVDWALGSAAASNVALTSTMVDILPMQDEKAFAATGNGYSTATSGALAASVQIDGTTTAVPVYLNFGFSDILDIDADAVIQSNATITLTWVHLGDY